MAEWTPRVVGDLPMQQLRPRRHPVGADAAKHIGIRMRDLGGGSDRFRWDRSWAILPDRSRWGPVSAFTDLPGHRHRSLVVCTPALIKLKLKTDPEPKTRIPSLPQSPWERRSRRSASPLVTILAL